MKRTPFTLQFITHQTPAYTCRETAQIALQGGCDWVQLRMKEAQPEELEQEARYIQRLCKTHRATFIIDDHVELAKTLGADGVHLGKSDMPIAEARRLLGDNVIIGGTANTIEDIRNHHQAGADYVGIGPFRFTTTKKNLSAILGLEGYKHLLKQMKEEDINMPVVAIGGIDEADIPSLMQTGITGIALSGAILTAQNPVEKTKRIIQSINQIKFLAQTI